MSGANTHRPSSPDPLREFLRARLTPAQVRLIASADWDLDGDRIAAELTHNLETGEYTYAGDGNPYEVATMQMYFEGPDRPLFELFGGWWLAAFCSEPRLWVLIENLGGAIAPLTMVCRGCAGLGADASRAAHAALPLVGWLRERDPYKDAEAQAGNYEKAARALEAVERLGEKAVQSGRWAEFFSS